MLLDFSISLSGDTLVVGTGEKNLDTQQVERRMAIVYQRYNSTWIQQANLAQGYEQAASTGQGWTTALAGDVVVTGEPEINTSEPAWGLARVFSRDGSAWNLWAELYPFPTVGQNLGQARFGYALAFDGETLAISAPWKDDPEPQAGAVYVFDFVGKTNVQREWQVYR